MKGDINYHDKWLSDEICFRLVKRLYGNTGFKEGKEEFTRTIMNRALGRMVFICDSGDALEREDGLFRKAIHRRCPVENKERRIYLYQVSKTKKSVQMPTQEEIKNSFDPAPFKLPPSPSKRNPPSSSDLSSSTENKRPRVEERVSTKLAETENFWTSKDAKKLFYSEADWADEEATVAKVMERRVEKLRNVSKQPEGWRDVINGGDKDNVMTALQILHTQQRCQMLVCAYVLALNHLRHPKQKQRLTWNECCCGRNPPPLLPSTRSIHDPSGEARMAHNLSTADASSLLLSSFFDRFKKVRCLLDTIMRLSQ